MDVPFSNAGEESVNVMVKMGMIRMMVLINDGFVRARVRKTMS